MAKNQVWVSSVGDMAQVLEMAKRVYPNATNDTERYRRALAGWFADRESGGKGQKLDRLANDVLALSIKLDLMNAQLQAIQETLLEVCKEKKLID